MPQASRREFLHRVALTGAAVTLGSGTPCSAPAGSAAPVMAAIPSHRVIHTHAQNATFWDYSTGWYGDYIDQAIVNEMTDRGVMALTNTSVLVDAWHALIPSYAAGQKVAIKINLNNAGCDDTGQVIDALPQPIIAVIRGLKAIGVAENNICVFDVTDGWHSGTMPGRLVNKITALYPSIQFHANEPGCSTALGYSATQRIHFNVPIGKPAIGDRPICQALVNAAYLINYDEVPSPWPTFGNESPNSLYFSVDPVAIDCVMYDFLNAEGGVPYGSDDYLKLANASGLGTFEHWDAGHQYHTIDYQRIETGSTTWHRYLPVVAKGAD